VSRDKKNHLVEEQDAFRALPQFPALMQKALQQAPKSHLQQDGESHQAVIVRVGLDPHNP
jgi:hypothetical protein